MSPRAPALQSVDVLFLPPPTVLRRLLVSDFPPDLLQDPLLCLGAQGVSVPALNRPHLPCDPGSSEATVRPLGWNTLWGSELPWSEAGERAGKPLPEPADASPHLSGTRPDRAAAGGPEQMRVVRESPRFQHPGLSPCMPSRECFPFALRNN